MSQNVCLMDLSYGSENMIFVQTKNFLQIDERQIVAGNVLFTSSTENGKGSREL